MRPFGQRGGRTAFAIEAVVVSPDRLHVLIAQLEVEHVEVLLYPLGCDGLGENDVAALDVPAQDDLGG